MKLRLGPTFGALVACLGTAAVVTACEGSSTETDVPPLTGIRVDSLALFGPDSCGAGDDQISKLVILVDAVDPEADAGADPCANPTAADLADAAALADAGTQPEPELVDGHPLTKITRSGVFECFADASFLVSLPAFSRYRLRVFGYSSAGYATAFGVISDSLQSGKDPETCRSACATQVDGELSSPALAVASCSAIQQVDVVGTACCSIDRDSRRRGPADAGTDADTATDSGDAATDAGDASDGDAGDAATDAGDASDGAP